MSEEKRLLTTGDVAKRAGVTRTAVLHWIKSGKLQPALTTPGGHYRVGEEEVERFLQGYGGARSPAPTQQRILVVDDDPTILDIVVRALQPALPNVAFETASDGVDAGMKLLRFAPDLLILDLLLPGIDGFEVCRLVRGDPELKSMAILCITGYNRPGMYEEAIAAGADDCLFKPLDMTALRERAQQLLRSRAA